MAASLFERDDLQAPLAEINVTPFVDVMLVLLVVFLVTAPMLTQSIKLELPHETATEMKDEKAVTLSIDASGQYYWEDAPISVEELKQHFSVTAAKNPKQLIQIRADAGVAYGKVSHVLASASKIGLSNIGFITDPKQP